METVAKRIILGSSVEISTSPAAAATAAGVGALACGYLLFRAGTSLGLSALGGILGGIGAFAVVARPRRVEEFPDDDAANGAMVSGETDLAGIVAYLEEHLGREVTGYVSGIEPEELEIVGLWASGKSRPELLPAKRLQTAFEATRRIVPFYDGKTAQSWFFGSWMGGGKAPAHLLRHSASPEIWSQVSNAAQEFVERTR
jgi:hypothetical protein